MEELEFEEIEFNEELYNINIQENEFSDEYGMGEDANENN